MNDDRSLEQRFADAMHAEHGSARLPSAFTDEFRSRASDTRQRPRWLALIKENPMRSGSTLTVGSPTAQGAAVLLASLLLAVALVAIGVAGSRLLAADGATVVDQSGDGDFTTIAAAVAAAVDGDEISVRPGTYDEQLSVDKAVTIRGDGDRAEVVIEVSEPLPDGANALTPDLPFALRLVDSEASIESMTIRGLSSLVRVEGGAPSFREMHFDRMGQWPDDFPGQISWASGVEVDGGSEATFEDNRFERSQLVIEEASPITIRGNEFVGSGMWMEGAGVDPLIDGNDFRDFASNAVEIWGGAKPTVTGNEFSGIDVAIQVQDAGWLVDDRGTDPTITDNVIDAVTGMTFSGAKGTVDGNRIDTVGFGVSLSSSDAIVRDNAIASDSIGVMVLIGGAPLIEGNDIEAGQFGIRLASGTEATIRDNSVCGGEEHISEMDGAQTVEVSDSGCDR